MSSTALLKKESKTQVASKPVFKKDAGMFSNTKTADLGSDGLYQGVNHSFSKINVYSNNGSRTNPLIQPKLKVNQPGDSYEQEADAIADKVMRMKDTTAIQAFSNATIAPVQRKCAHCKEEEESVQLKPAPHRLIQKKCAACEEEEKTLQRKELGNSVIPTISPTVEQTLQSSGQPMDKSTRSFMEQRFGYDFGNVQIHNDALAHQSSNDINALAYTHGNHVVFGEGEYRPKSYSGKRLLAHELAHVVQQENKYYGIQRSCGRRQITKGTPGCTGLGSDLDDYVSTTDDTFKFKLGCDEFLPGEEERFREVLRSLPTGQLIDIHGFASEEGSENFNDDLSCARGHTAWVIANDEDIIINNIFYHGEKGEKEGNREELRSVVIKSADDFDKVENKEEKKSQALVIAKNDCKMATTFYLNHNSKAVSLFLKIYKCLTCSFTEAIEQNKFNDPLWVAKVNHATIMRLEQALSQRTGLYKDVMKSCDYVDDIKSGTLGLNLATYTANPGLLLLNFQSCTENMGMVHLLVDLTESLKEIGCATPENMIDFRDKIPPLFESCNKAVLDEEFLILGDWAAETFAIPTIHNYRNQAWNIAGCYPYK